MIKQNNEVSLIACLDLVEGRVVKGTNFIDIKDVGDAFEFAKKYQDQGADELILLDISATKEGRNNFFNIMEKIVSKVSIPVGVGGGIRSIEDASKLLSIGAKKVGINSAAVARPELILELSKEFGRDAVVVSIDAKTSGNSFDVVVRGGSDNTGLDALSWARQAQDLGAGEILLTSIDRDGTRDGYDIEMLRAVKENVTIPVVASGGAGSIEDVIEVFDTGVADAALLAGILHDGSTTITEIKNVLDSKGYLVR